MPAERSAQDIPDDKPFRARLALVNGGLRAAREGTARTRLLDLLEPMLEDLAHDLVLGDRNHLRALDLVARRAGVGQPDAVDTGPWLDAVIAALELTGLVSANRDGAHFPDTHTLAFFVGAKLVRHHPDPAVRESRSLLRPRLWWPEDVLASRVALVAHWQLLDRDLTGVLHRLLRPWNRRRGTGMLAAMARYGVELPPPVTREATTHLQRRLGKDLARSVLDRLVLELHGLDPACAVTFLCDRVPRRGWGAANRLAFAEHLFRLGGNAGTRALIGFLVDPLVPDRHREVFWQAAKDHARKPATALAVTALGEAEDGAVRNSLTALVAQVNPARARAQYERTAREGETEQIRLTAAVSAFPLDRKTAVELLFEQLWGFRERDNLTKVMAELHGNGAAQRLVEELGRLCRSAEHRPELRFAAALYRCEKLRGPADPLIELAHEHLLPLVDALIAVKKNPNDRRVRAVCDAQVRKHEPGGSPAVLDTIKEIGAACGRVTSVDVGRYYVEVLEEPRWDHDIRKRALADVGAALTVGQRVAHCRLLYRDPKASAKDKLWCATTARQIDPRVGLQMFRDLAWDDDIGVRTKLEAAEEVGDAQIRFELCEQIVNGSKEKALLLRCFRLVDSDEGGDELVAQALRKRSEADRVWLLRNLELRHRERVSALLAPPEKTNPA
ncbi:hypothetical protein APASM_2637 [Actinosynnema pretiosum subsp. pretiosum]|nr:hypothetical protein APASM_2637 [Actinosynnema pretiosum subsp. pretiosum]